MSGGDSTATLAKQTGITLFGNVIGKSLKFGFVIAATWLVSPGKFGLYVLAFSVVSLLQSVSNLGMDQAIDYYVPDLLRRGKERDARTYVATIALLTVFGSSAIGIGLVAAAPWVESTFGEPGLADALVLFAIGVPLLALQSVANTLFVSVKRMDLQQVATNLFRPIIKLSGAVALVAAGLGVSGLVLGHVLALAVALSISVFLVAHNVDWLRRTDFSSMPIREVVSYSLPLAFAGIVFGVIGQIDFFVLGYYRNASDVGIYRVAYLLAGSLTIFHASLTPIFKPLIVEVHEDTEAMISQYLLATRWVAMITLPVAVALLILPGTYLSLIFGDQYATSAVAFLILVVGHFLNIAVGPTSRILEAMGKTKLVFLNTAFLGVVNIGLDILLVPHYGLIGAAIGTAAALTSVGIIALLQVWYIWGVHPFYLDLMKIYVAIVPVAGAAVGLAHLVSPLIGAVSVPIFILGAYIVLLRFLGAFTEDDIKTARRIDDRIGRPVVESIIR